MSFKIYCEVCGKHQVAAIDKMLPDVHFPQQGIWGDVTCSVCHYVIATITVDEPGQYDLVKVSD